MMIDMMDFGRTIFHMVMEEWYMQMEMFMKVNGILVNEMVMVCSQNEMETTLKEDGLMINEKDKVVIFTLQRTKFLLENG